MKSGKPTRELCNCAETVASVKRQRKDPIMLSFVASTCLEMLYLHGNEKKNADVHKINMKSKRGTTEQYQFNLRSY